MLDSPSCDNLLGGTSSSWYRYNDKNILILNAINPHLCVCVCHVELVTFLSGLKANRRHTELQFWGKGFPYLAPGRVHAIECFRLLRWGLLGIQTSRSRQRTPPFELAANHSCVHSIFYPANWNKHWMTRNDVNLIGYNMTSFF